MNQRTHLNNAPETFDLAGQYVLGTLNAQEKIEFEALLENSVALQNQVNQWQAHLITLTDQLDPTPPPQPLSARIERSLDVIERQKQTDTHMASVAQAKQPVPFWERLTVWRGAAAACLALSVLLGVKLQSEPMEAGFTKPTYIAVLVTPEDKKPGWVIQTSLQTQTGQAEQIQLIPLGAMEIPEGKALQFWTKADGWDAPVSLGLIKKGEALNIDIRKLPALTDNQLFEFTLEQESGSPTGKPTGPIQSIGRGALTL